MLSTLFNLFLFGLTIRILAKAAKITKGKSMFFTFIRTCDWIIKFFICVAKVILCDLSNIFKKLYTKTNKIMQNKTKHNEHKDTIKQSNKKVVNGNNDFYEYDNVIELFKRKKK